MKFHAKNSLFLAYFLNLLFPGFGHAYWREYLFGIFIYLIMLLAAALFFVSLFFPFSIWAKLALFGMPAIFYLFSFFDLTRSVRGRRKTISPTGRRAAVFIALGLIHFLAVPYTPGNMLIRNSPDFYRMTNNDYSPRLRRGDVVAANSLAYKANIFFLDKPVLHDLPQLADIVSYMNENGNRATGLVLALPHQALEIVGGRLFLDGMPAVVDDPLINRLSGDWPLTYTDNYSVLVADLRLGVVESVRQVAMEDIRGKVRRIL